jgi:hypothetical protein
VAGQICANGTCQTPFSGLTEFTFVDLDNNGSPDVIGPLNPGPYTNAKIARVLQTAPGVWGTPAMTDVSSAAGTSVQGIAAGGDFNSDSLNDLLISVVTQSGGSSGPPTTTAVPVLLLNNGAGGVTIPAQPASLAGPWNAPITLGVADVDGDGIPDSLIMDNYQFKGVSPPTPKVTVLFGNGSGGLGSPLGVSYPSTINPTYADCGDAKPLNLATNSFNGDFTVGDLNGDGKADLLFGEAVLLSLGSSRAFGAPGRLEGLITTSLTSSGGGSSPPIAVDIDGDGKAEVLFAGQLFSGGGPQPATAPCGVEVGRINVPNVHTW